MLTSLAVAVWYLGRSGQPCWKVRKAETLYRSRLAEKVYALEEKWSGREAKLQC